MLIITQIVIAQPAQVDAQVLNQTDVCAEIVDPPVTIIANTDVTCDEATDLTGASSSQFDFFIVMQEFSAGNLSYVR